MISYSQNDNAFVQRVKQEKTSAQNQFDLINGPLPTNELVSEIK